MTLDYIITLDYRQNEPFTRQKILGGKGEEELVARGRVHMAEERRGKGF